MSVLTPISLDRAFEEESSSFKMIQKAQKKRDKLYKSANKAVQKFYKSKKKRSSNICSVFDKAWEKVLKVRQASYELAFAKMDCHDDELSNVLKLLSTTNTNPFSDMFMA
jgi:uncharacterized protein with NRDE domain